MKVLWIINAPTPRAAIALGVPPSGFPTWIEAGYEAAVSRGDLDVILSFPWHGPPRSTSSGGATFTTFPTVEFGR